MIDVVFKGRFTVENRVNQLYRSFGFEVPEGASGILVDVQYTKTATAALDVGLSDSNGFRGWSGSERQHIEIGKDASTPGYMAGSIPAGQWNVEIGLHRIPEEGLEYEIRIRMGNVEVEPRHYVQPPVRTSHRRDLPAEPGMQWLAGDLGIHTYHSNGLDTVDEVATKGIEKSLDFLVIADFNTTSHYRDLGALRDWPITLIPGQTIAIDDGHTMIIGSPNWEDLRNEPKVWAQNSRAKGALLAACYPTRTDAPWRVPVSGGPELFELWTGSSWTIDQEAVSWWKHAGPNVIPIGSSGWTGGKGGQDLGRPVTWVETQDGDVLQGLRDGRTAVSASIDGPVILRQGTEIVALRAAGCELVDWGGEAVAVTTDRQRITANNLPYLLRNSHMEFIAVCK